MSSTSGGHFQLIALDAHTGRSLWEVPTTGPVHTSPAVAGNRLYIGLQDWRVLALDRQTGTTLWEFTMQRPGRRLGLSGEGMVYIGSMDGFLYALDAATGELIWKFKTQEQALSPPAIDEGTLFLSSTDGQPLRSACQDRTELAALSHPGPSAGLPRRRQRLGLFPLWGADIRCGSRCP